jgi:hypothetical protein
MILFRWLFSDGVATATFARTGDATFTAFTAPATVTLYRAYDLSMPYIAARVADAGGTL